MIGQLNDTESVFVWQNNATSYFSVSLKFGACYMTGQWGFQNKNSTLYYHLKFENSLSSNELFSYIFCFEKNVYTAENDQINYLSKSGSLKSYFSLCKQLLDCTATAINYVSLSLRILSKDFFIIQETACSSFVLDSERAPHQIEHIL